jgi:hypothetical protein
MTPTTADPAHIAMGRAMVGLTVGYEPVPGSPAAGDYEVTRTWISQSGRVMVDLFRPARASNQVDRTTTAQVIDVTVVSECTIDYVRRLPSEYAAVTGDN